MRSMIFLSVSVLGLCTAPTAAISASSAPSATWLYKNPDAPIAARVSDLLSHMTLEEKVAQLQARSTLLSNQSDPAGATQALGIVHNDGHVDEAIAVRTLSNGIGVFALFDPKPIPAAVMVAQQNAIQSWVLTNTRLGIPVIFQAEALHGVNIEGATSFPQAVGLGSTWDPPLIREMFAAVGKEARAVGISMVLAPVLDLSRDPRFGRVEEMYSEDPFLVGEMGVAAIEGLQGSSGLGLLDQYHVIATAKHFVHGQPENGTNKGPNDVSERTMRAIFLAPFEKAVKVAHVGAIMPSYNENNGGVPSHVNRWLLKDILRNEWAFTGVTDSDWLAINFLHEPQGVAANEADAGVQAFNAGVDMDSPNGDCFTALGDAARAGSVSQQDIDSAVSRVLTLKFRAGLFEHPLTDPMRRLGEIGANETQALARKVADEAIVLLKNENNILPLNPAKLHSIAVIGPNASKVRLGGYSGVPPYFVTVLDGIRRRLGNKVKVRYEEGVRIASTDGDPASNTFAAYLPSSAAEDKARIARAVKTAHAAQIVVLVLGDNETITREAAEKLLGDTDELDLPENQNALVRAITRLGKPTIAVLLNGRARSTIQLSQLVPAIVEGWYGGQETGNAIAGVLFGDVNPSGKLPMSIARNAGQLPVFYYKTPQARLGYVFNDNSPLYPFGFGLSYTRFVYGHLTLERAQIRRGETTNISVAITNAGSRAGEEIVQMYIHPLLSSVVQPVLRLAGFRRVRLNPGESETVTFEVGPEQRAIWNREMQRVVESGSVDVIVGPSSQIHQSITLEIQP
jgi:beta-glucosidase